MQTIEQTLERQRPPIGATAENYVAHYEDAATWLAEAMDGSMYTPFNFRLINGEVIGDDGRAMLPILEKSLNDAEALAHEDPQLSFEVRRREIELEEYQDILTVANGGPDTLVTVSDFPPELMKSEEGVGGYNGRRKQTMLRIVTRQADGTIKMETKSLDQSNREALENIYTHLGFEVEAGELLGQRMLFNAGAERKAGLVEELRQVYDDSLAQQLGGYWYAGRQPADETNTYDFVKQQADVLDYIAGQAQEGVDPKTLYYDAAATIEKRRHKVRKMQVQVQNIEVSYQQIVQPLGPGPSVMREMVQAGFEARSEGKSYSACGMTAKSSDSVEVSLPKLLSEVGFGNQADKPADDEDEYGSLTFTCPKNGCTNIRPRGELIAECQECGADVTC